MKKFEKRLKNLEEKEVSGEEEENEESKTVSEEELNIESYRNIKDLNKKLIKKNYENNNKERNNELLKVKELVKKYWININNEVTLKREVLNNIDDEKIIKGYIEKEDTFIKKKKIRLGNKNNKNYKWEKIKTIVKEKKDVWKLNLKEDMEISIFKDKEGDLCIYNEIEEEVVKKYCGFCLEDTHEKKNCWNIMKLVNSLNINWKEFQVKDNICCLCGGFHKMDNVNNIKKFKCSMLNKIIEIVLFLTCNAKKSYEDFEVIKDKEKDYLKEIDIIFKIISENYELIVKNVDKEEKFKNNWFKSVAEIVKFIKLGYKLWDMKGKNISNRRVKQKEIKSIKILGRSNNKKEIIAEMYDFLKKIKFLKLDMNIAQKGSIKWKRNLKDKGFELKDNMLIKIYWKLLEINAVWKVNDVLYKKKDVEIYLNKENNLFKRIFNKLFIGNILKEENNLNIKKLLAKYIQKLKNKKNDKDIDNSVNKLIEEIRDLENKDFKGKIIRREKKEEISNLTLEDYIDDEKEEKIETENNKIWLNENKKKKIIKKKKEEKKEIEKRKEEKEKRDDKEKKKEKIEEEEKEDKKEKEESDIITTKLILNKDKEIIEEKEKKSNSMEIKKKEFTEDKEEKKEKKKMEKKGKKEEKVEKDSEDDLI